ncbi:MAG: hypothetical protein ACRDNF_09515 [Streptosporangiaceae bacterium]
MHRSWQQGRAARDLQYWQEEPTNAQEEDEGPEGNERLTALTGALLLVLLAAEGFTILSLHQLLYWHFFIGLLLIGPVTLKICSTLYRFGRYYTGHPGYVRKGPPDPLLRLLGPLVVLSTVAVLGTGVMLGLLGPGSSLAGRVLQLHKLSFIAWIVVVSVHDLAYVWRLPRLIGADLPAATARHAAEVLRGRGLRWTLAASCLGAGVVIAVSGSHLVRPWQQPPLSRPPTPRARPPRARPASSGCIGPPRSARVTQPRYDAVRHPRVPASSAGAADVWAVARLCRQKHWPRLYVRPAPASAGRSARAPRMQGWYPVGAGRGYMPLARAKCYWCSRCSRCPERWSRWPCYGYGAIGWVVSVSVHPPAPLPGGDPRTVPEAGTPMAGCLAEEPVVVRGVAVLPGWRALAGPARLIARPAGSVMITPQVVAGWLARASARVRQVSACSGPNPAASPGRSASPSSVASGMVRCTDPVSGGSAGPPAGRRSPTGTPAA